MGKVKSKKRKRSSSSDSSSSSSESSREKKKLRKLKKKLKKEQKKTERALKKKLKEKKKLKRDRRSKSSSKSNESKKKEEEKSCDVPIALLEISKAMAPMTKEEWERRQSVVRKVMDEETGRYRLIKGDGEVLEEIVSRSRQKEINRQATRADGAFFQSQTMDKEYL